MQLNGHIFQRFVLGSFVLMFFGLLSWEVFFFFGGEGVWGVEQGWFVGFLFIFWGLLCLVWMGFCPAIVAVSKFHVCTS